MIIYFCTHF